MTWSGGQSHHASARSRSLVASSDTTAHWRPSNARDSRLGAPVIRSLRLRTGHRGDRCRTGDSVARGGVRIGGARLQAGRRRRPRNRESHHRSGSNAHIPGRANAQRIAASHLLAEEGPGHAVRRPRGLLHETGEIERTTVRPRRGCAALRSGHQRCLDLERVGRHGERRDPGQRGHAGELELAIKAQLRLPDTSAGATPPGSSPVVLAAVAALGWLVLARWSRDRAAV